MWIHQTLWQIDSHPLFRPPVEICWHWCKIKPAAFILEPLTECYHGTRREALCAILIGIQMESSGTVSSNVVKLVYPLVIITMSCGSSKHLYNCYNKIKMVNWFSIGNILGSWLRCCDLKIRRNAISMVHTEVLTWKAFLAIALNAFWKCQFNAIVIFWRIH